MRAWGIFGALIVIAAVTWAIRGLLPPDTLRMAAGPVGGAYERIAQEYREILARDGIDLQIIDSAGSAENINLLGERLADVAILQGGVRSDVTNIAAIGSIFFEPMVFLVRAGNDIPTNPRHWDGLKINIGAPGSGTAAAYRDFALAVQIPGNANTLLHLPYDQAIGRLSAGELDIAVFVAPLLAPYLEDAYYDPQLRFLNLDYVEAISRRMGYPKIVTVPAGAIALDRVIPQTPRRLLAMDARLAIRDDLHPALVNRLTMAARELHSGQGLITDEDRFPSASGTGLPVNNAARQLILEGPSAWHDWLPYWMAAQVNRVLILLLPIFFILVPLLQALPGLFAYVMGWRVWKFYPIIRGIEAALEGPVDRDTLEQMRTDLTEIDETLSQLRLPAPYRSGAYNARLHVDLVLQRIRSRLAGEAGTGSL